MRRALLAVLAGRARWRARLPCHRGAPLDAGNGLALWPGSNLACRFHVPRLAVAIGVLQSAQATFPALLGGWLWGATSHPGRMAALVGLMIALAGSVAQYALFCMKYSCHSPVEDSLFQIFLPIAQASIAAAVAAYAGMRLRRG